MVGLLKLVLAQPIALERGSNGLPRGSTASTLSMSSPSKWQGMVAGGDAERDSVVLHSPGLRTELSAGSVLMNQRNDCTRAIGKVLSTACADTKATSAHSIPRTHLRIKLVLLKDLCALSVASVRVSVGAPNKIRGDRSTVVEIVCTLRLPVRTKERFYEMCQRRGCEAFLTLQADAATPAVRCHVATRCVHIWCDQWVGEVAPGKLPICRVVAFRLCERNLIGFVRGDLCTLVLVQVQASVSAARHDITHPSGTYTQAEVVRLGPAVALALGFQRVAAWRIPGRQHWKQLL